MNEFEKYKLMWESLKKQTDYYTNVKEMYAYMQELEEIFELNNSKERVVKPGEIYKHFKGNYYKVLEIAHSTETSEKLVIYIKISQNSEGIVYARPYDMFISKVDREKYPDVAQEYRFEKVFSKL